MLVFSREAYETHWHGILETTADTLQPHLVCWSCRLLHACWSHTNPSRPPAAHLPRACCTEWAVSGHTRVPLTLVSHMLRGTAAPNRTQWAVCGRTTLRGKDSCLLNSHPPLAPTTPLTRTTSHATHTPHLSPHDTCAPTSHTHDEHARAHQPLLHTCAPPLHTFVRSHLMHARRTRQPLTHRAAPTSHTFVRSRLSHTCAHERLAPATQTPPCAGQANRRAAGLEAAGEGPVPRGPRRISLTVRRVCRLRHENTRFCTPEAREEDLRKTRWWLASRGEDGL